VIALEVFGKSDSMAAVASRLDQMEGVGRVRLAPATRAEHAIVMAVVRPRAVDPVLDELNRLGVPDADITLTRMELVGRAARRQVDASLVWEDVLGMAWINSRPIARYVAFMFVAGVVACYGVVDENAILIVGAMAVSPDLLPIVAAAVGVIGLRAVLAGRAILTLVVGLGISSAAAALCTLVQDRLDLIPSGFDIHEAGVLGGLTTVSNETVAVALAAGVAGMLALETRASSGVGVAISVTTIPAAAYLGVAAGLGEASEAAGALGVLGTNVAMLVVGASVTLALQRLLMHRTVARRRRSAT
jgi:uncharacterized hydrophobic protein (TIGR00271 family)